MSSKAADGVDRAGASRRPHTCSLLPQALRPQAASQRPAWNLKRAGLPLPCFVLGGRSLLYGGSPNGVGMTLVHNRQFPRA